MPRNLLVVRLACLASLSACANESTPFLSTAQEGSPPITVATANAEVVFEGETVVLDGSLSTDRDGDIVGYAWTQASGPAIAINDANKPRAYFVAPNVSGVTYVRVLLAVTDAAGASTFATVGITVIDRNRAPSADAGPDQQVLARAVVALDGSASLDADGSLVSYGWQQVSGPSTPLSSTGEPQTSFVAPDVTAPTVLAYRLVVSDNEGRTGSDEVRIAVAPVAAGLAFVDASLPSPATRNVVWSDVRVSILNKSGQRITQGTPASLPVSLALASGSGTLTGAGTTTAVAGVATFRGLVYDVEESILLRATTSVPALAASSPRISVGWTSAMPGVLGEGTALDVLASASVSESWGTELVLAGAFSGSFDPAIGGGGVSRTASTRDGFVARYGTDGSLAWLRQLGGSGDDEVVAVAAAANGDLFVLLNFDSSTLSLPQSPGSLGASAKGGGDFALARLDGSGFARWAVVLGGSGLDKAYGLALDESDDPLIVGAFQSSSIDFDPGSGTAMAALTGGSGSDLFAVKLDAAALGAGNLDAAYLWHYAVGSAGDDVARAALFDTGSVYIGGAFAGDLDFDPGTGTDQHAVVSSASSTALMSAFVTRLAEDGSYGWTKTFGGDSGESSVAALAVHPSGGVAAAGVFAGLGLDPGGSGSTTADSTGASDLFLLGFDASGSLKDMVAFGSNANDTLGGLVVVDGALWLLGAVGGSVDVNKDAKDDITVAAGASSAALVKLVPAAGGLTLEGAWSWSATDNSVSATPVACSGLSLAAAAAGSVFVVGAVDGPQVGTGVDVDLDPSSTSVLATTSYASHFVIKLDVDGVLVP